MLIQKEAGKVLLTIVPPAFLVQSLQRTCYYGTVIIPIAQLDVKQQGGDFCLPGNTFG
jgi:hypothetical protein